MLRNTPGNLIKAGGKVARYTLPAMGMMMGAIGGLATGDIANAAKYAAAGAATGSTFGKGADKFTKKVGNKSKGQSVKNAYLSEYNKTKYLDPSKVMEKQQRAIYNQNKAIYEKSDHLDKEDIKAANDICVQYGITNPYEVMAVAQMARERAGTDETRDKETDKRLLEERIQVAIAGKKAAEEEGDDFKTPKHKDWVEARKEKFMKKGNLTEDQANQAVEMLDDEANLYINTMKEMEEQKRLNEMYE